MEELLEFLLLLIVLLFVTPGGWLVLIIFGVWIFG